jgi:hypothetical protein
VLMLRGQSLRVAPEAGRVGDPELLGDICHGMSRGSARKVPRKRICAQLDSEAETVVVTATLVDQRPVDVVEKTLRRSTEPGQLGAASLF